MGYAFKSGQRESGRCGVPHLAGIVAEAGSRLGIKGKRKFAKFYDVVQITVGDLLFSIYA